MLTNSIILLTGGTGSFGHSFVKLTLKKYNPKKIIIFSRDEMKQWVMSKLYENDPRISFMIGDIRDKDRVNKAVKGADYVVHAAATKIAPLAEYNPSECVKTNIDGANNLIDACIENNVKKVVALSTDKASDPINLYGATKLVSDKLFIAANIYDNQRASTKFSSVRYGNVMGSRGSVIPFFLSIADSGELLITDPRMTRFMITQETAIELIWHAFEDMNGGEVYIKKIPSMNITDIAKAVSETAKHKLIGIRPGEKIHEQMIGIEDAPYTYEYDGHYKILPAIFDTYKNIEWIGNGVKVSNDFCYTSDNNKNWMSISSLKSWIEDHRATIGKF
jgi:UDP-N-acetylglucosamine 4,6-dehydratase/5-epimerase